MTSSPRIDQEIKFVAASSRGFQVVGQALDQYFEDRRWLASTNTYRDDVVGQIIDDCKTGGGLNSRDLCEYVAVSVPLHLAEGWEYLGQALYALLSGQPQVAVHLGYYAELRAAMSLLATQGFGVFSSYHCAIDGIGEAHCLPSKGGLGTHDAAWAFLKEWADLTATGGRISEWIRPRGIPLSEWINSLPCTAEEGWNPVLSSVLQDVGLDLERMRDDRRARNYASYRPWDLRERVDWSLEEAVEFVVESVQLIEPSGIGRFDSLDQHLLREVVDRVFVAKTDSSPESAVREYEREIVDMVRSCVDEDLVREELKSLFFQERPLLLRMAFDMSDTGDPRPLLARAVLLLRIATSAARVFMSDVDIEFQRVAFWWQTRGQQLGLWDGRVEDDEIMDMWLDVMSALEDLNDWQAKDGGSVREMLTEFAYPVHETTNLGRIPIMGLA